MERLMSAAEYSMEGLDLESLVSRFSRTLYQFALALTCSEPDAVRLTQRAFYQCAKKQNPSYDALRVKTWLFATVYREFAATKSNRAQSQDTPSAEFVETLSIETIRLADRQILLSALQEISVELRAVVILFYLEDFSFPDIAAMTGMSADAVKAQIAQGLLQLKHAVEGRM